MIPREPSTQCRHEYGAAMRAIRDAVDTGRPLRLTARQARALDVVTSYRRARAQGTYSPALDTAPDSVYR